MRIGLFIKSMVTGTALLGLLAVAPNTAFACGAYPVGSNVNDVVVSMVANGSNFITYTSQTNAGASRQGMLVYNRSNNSLVVCDGTAWRTLASSGGVAAAGTTGQVQFNNAGVLAADAAFFWDNTNKRLGIGTVTPTSPLHVIGGVIRSQADSVSAGIISDTFGTGLASQLTLRTSRGTAASPVYPSSGDTLGYIGFRNHGNFTGADIFSNATENHTASVSGGNIIFRTTPNTTQTITERMRIDQNGNVGIGATGPTIKLQVSGTGGNGGMGQFESTNSWNSVKIKGVNGAGINDSAFLSFEDAALENTFIGLVGTAGQGSGNVGDLRFGVGGTERMRISKTTGNVGIGTTSPSADSPLHIMRNTASTQRLTVQNTNTSNGAQARFDLATGTANSYSIMSISEAGAGSTTFEVATGDGILNGMFFTSGATATNRPIVFRQGASERMRIHTNGNVGIGAAAPDNPLTVETTAAAQSWLRLRNLSANAAATQGVLLGNDANASLAGLFLGSSAYTNTTYAGAGSLNLGTYSTGRLGIFTNSVERMRFTADGRVFMGSDAADNLAFEGGLLNRLTVRATTQTYTVPSSGAALVLRSAAGGTNINSGYAYYGHGGYGWAMGLNADAGTSIANTDGSDFVLLNSAHTTPTPGLTMLVGGNFGVGTMNPRSLLHVTQPSSASQYALFQGVGSGGTAFTSTDTIPIVTGNGFIGYNGIALIPGRWGNATTADSHNVVYIGGAQRNVGAISGSLAFANWGYFTGTGAAAGGLGNATAQGDAVKFDIRLEDGGGEFTQRLNFRSRSASATSLDTMTLYSNGFVRMGSYAGNAAYNLDVQGLTAGSDSVIRAVSSGNVARLILQNTGTSGRQWSFSAYKDTLNPNGGFAIADETASAVRMVIDNAGNVGIGGANPINYRLVIEGTPNNTAKLGLLSIGRSGTEYPSVGYNVRYGGTANAYTYDATDTASMIRFNSGQVQTFTAASGTAGGTISFTQGPFVAQGGNSWTNGSDRRLKDNILPYSVLDKLDAYQAVSFDWKQGGLHDLGVIAQEIYKIFPEVVVKGDELPELDGSGKGQWGVQYDKLGALALQAAKELKAENDAVKAENAALKTQLEALDARLKALESK